MRRVRRQAFLQGKYIGMRRRGGRFGLGFLREGESSDENKNGNQQSFFHAAHYSNPGGARLSLLEIMRVKQHNAVAPAERRVLRT
jgi:hypothetical protein